MSPVVQLLRLRKHFTEEKKNNISQIIQLYIHIEDVDALRRVLDHQYSVHENGNTLKNMNNVTGQRD